MLWYRLFAAPITSAGKRLRCLRPYDLQTTVGKEVTNAQTERLTRQSACSSEIYNRQACFLLRPKNNLARGSSLANENHMQGPDVLTELFYRQQQHFQAASKSAANRNACSSRDRYSAGFLACKVGVHSSAVA